MQISVEMPQRLAVVIEKNKSQTWGVAAYLVRADGLRERRCLATCESYEDATHALRQLWLNARPS